MGLEAQDRPYGSHSQRLKRFSLSLTRLSISGPAQTVSWSDLDGPIFGRKAMANLVCVLKSRDITANKGVDGQTYGFSSSPVWMWELDYKESWVPENWWFWTVVLEKTLESPLDCKEIQPVHPRENQSWIFTGRTDAKAETPILWPPDAKSRLIGEDLMLGEIEGKSRRGRQRMRWSDSITDSTDMNLSKAWEIVGDRGAAVHGVTKSWTQPGIWTTTATPWLGTSDWHIGGRSSDLQEMRKREFRLSGDTWSWPGV